MLSDLKKIKKELVNSKKDNKDVIEEPKRFSEDFSIIRSKEDYSRQKFRELFEQGQKNAELNRSLIPNTD